MQIRSGLFIVALLLAFQGFGQFHEPPPFSQKLYERINNDSLSPLKIESLVISGNRKTKRYIIEREVLLKQGDSIKPMRLDDLVKRSQSLVYNTGLFTGVNIIPELTGSDDLLIRVEVKEKWYIYPTPQFQLVDRNFNDWVRNHDADLDRVIYGVKFQHFNFSGRRDVVRVFLLNGYTRNITASYSNPYSNSDLTEGFQVTGSFSKTRETSYRTSSGNKQVFYNNGKFVKDQFTIGGAYTMRRGYYTRHTVGASLNYLDVDDSITSHLNPGYYNSQHRRLYPEFTYSFQFTDVDNTAYPLKGIAFYSTALKKGLEPDGGINMFEVESGVSFFKPHGKNWYTAFSLAGKLKLPFDQPYINRNALGYRELYLRGLENYVIDGHAAFVGRYTLRKKILAFSVPVPFNIRILPSIPFAFYAKTYADAGYSASNWNYTRLNNRFLYSGGFGLDILSLYDFTLKLEYSFNQLGENGLFLHTKGGF